MEKKYILPASTLVAGILIWVVFLIVYKDKITSISEVSVGLITCGLLIFSALRCRKVGGPKAGNIFRASLLFIMAVLTYWLIEGMTSAIMLLAASVVVLFLALNKSEKLSKTAEV